MPIRITIQTCTSRLGTAETWSKPKPLKQLNTTHNESSAAFSPDGNYLYFSSDRPGGEGGFDLFVACASEDGWTRIQPLSDAINSAGDETGVSPSADGAGLYFSSDRGSDDGSKNIYFAKREEAGQDTTKQTIQAPPIPVFASAEPASRTQLPRR